MPEKVQVEVEGRRLVLSNLSKRLYPSGFLKAEVIDYYTRIAPVLLPHLAGRPLTVKRYPDGSEGKFFFEKNAPSHTPDWVRRVTLPVPGSTKQRETIDFVVVEELATLVWLANLAALELHTPQWTVGPKGGVHEPDLLVIDLDPGPPATITKCCEVALLARPLLPEGALAKTSGNKGMQIVAPWPGRRDRAGGPVKHSGDSSEAAKQLAELLEKEHPELVVSKMAQAVRPNKVFVDWSQNNRAKTTVSVYSLRARDMPAVSTPLTWDEVAEGADGRVLHFTAPDVLARVEEMGDLFAPLVPGA
ncbi:MAG TPA: non-homologous end-joining DNA ligase [Mycobacteriales bacterium]|nr:non-homologous end-joining DNA ligase [Mycobacteriales bacterium]